MPLARSSQEKPTRRLDSISRDDQLVSYLIDSIEKNPKVELSRLETDRYEAMKEVFENFIVSGRCSTARDGRVLFSSEVKDEAWDALMKKMR